MELAMIQGVIVPLNQIDPARLDRGTYFGDGVYEVIRSYDSSLFALDDHLARLKKNLAAKRKSLQQQAVKNFNLFTKLFR